MNKAEWMVALQFIALAPFVIPWPTAIEINSGSMVLLLGIILGFFTLFYNRPGNFNVRPKYKENSKLITDGPYRFSRHPIYLSLLISCTGLLIMQSSLWKWGFLILLFWVLNIKAAMEENIMKQHFPDYENYINNSRRWI